MNADEINRVREDYDRICDAIEAAVDADKTLVVIEQWVARLCDADSVTFFSVSNDTLFVNFQVYTQMTGGSYEYPQANIPLDTLNKYL